MASLKLLNDTVTLFNYIGEVDDRADYQETTLNHCYCILNEGADLNMVGHNGNDSAKLYIFDDSTSAVDGDGEQRTYLPFHLWTEEEDKTPYWTLSDKGTDYLCKQGYDNQLRIIGFTHKKSGSRRMWHYEVDAK